MEYINLKNTIFITKRSNFVLKLAISRVVSDPNKSTLNVSLRYAERDNIEISTGKIALKKHNEFSPQKHDFSTKIVIHF